MKEQTQTNQLQNFIIVQDGEVVQDNTPTALQVARQHVQNSLSGTISNIKLNARMAAFDALHGTNYRQIRKDLVRQQKLEAFEQSIGLVKR